MDTPLSPSPELADPLGAHRHRWWLIALTGALGLAGAGAWLRAQEPVWEATTSLLVQPVGQGATAVGGQAAVDVDTEARLVRTTAVATLAAERLGTSTAPEELAASVTVEVPPDTTVLEITFSATDPEAARLGAQAFADAYLAYREQRARDDLAAQVATVSTRIEELDEELTRVNELLVATPVGTAAAADLEARRGTLTAQLDTLNARLDELSTTTVSGGTVVSEARAPTEPSRPLTTAVLASGGLLGLVVGAACAVGADRLARRVRRPGDVTRSAHVPVLAVLPSRAAVAEAPSPGGAGGRVFDRLRNEVLAALGSTGQLIVVTSVSHGTAAAPVAAHLAASLSRAGNDVILLGSKESGVAGGPGLSAVVTGRVPVAEALRRHPRHAGLRSITVDEAAVATGQLQSPALRQVLSYLLRQAAYVVVEAPATCASADAQSLAVQADAALLVVESRRARLADVADAVEQLRRVGRRPLGAVVVPPLRPRAAARRADHRSQTVETPPRPRAQARPGSRLADLLDAPSPTARRGPRRRGQPYPPAPEPLRLPPVPPPASDDATITLPPVTLAREAGQDIGATEPVPHPALDARHAVVRE